MTGRIEMVFVILVLVSGGPCCQSCNGSDVSPDSSVATDTSPDGRTDARVWDLGQDAGSDSRWPGPDSGSGNDLLMELRRIGETNVVLSIDNLPNTCALEASQCGLGCARGHSVTVRRGDGATEVLMEGQLADPQDPDWLLRDTHVGWFEVADGEQLDICLSLKLDSGAEYGTACYQVAVHPGRSGQVLWALCDSECYAGPACPQPVRVEAMSPIPECDLGLTVLVTLGDCELFAPPVSVVSLSFLPSVACSEAEDWFATEFGLTSSDVDIECTVPPSGYPEPTILHVTLPDHETAMGLFVKALADKGAVPAVRLSNMREKNEIPDTRTIGVAWGQAGIAQAQWPCESLYSE